MSDFDTALERLVADPAFRDALAADPAQALAGYQLSPDELELLTAQVDTGTGGDRHVEQRTSKASLFGLLAPTGGFGFGSDPVDSMHGAGGGPPQEGFGTSGGAQVGPAYGPPGDAGFGSAGGGGGPQEGFGSAGQDGFGPAGSDDQTLGRAPEYDPNEGRAPEYVPPGAEPAQSEPTQSQGTLYSSAAARGDEFSTNQPPADYHTRVDADGDGRWDRFTAVDRGEQGVDLVVDRDGDGRAEFVGHDYDRDGLIDAADTDDNRDGQLDSRWVDDDGDGWLDRRAPGG